jgi:hypothetical protein
MSQNLLVIESIEIRAAMAFRLGLLILLIAQSAAAAPLSARPGTRDYERPNYLQVRDGVVNVAGGNFVHTRQDLSLDTRLGPTWVGATHNSGPNVWFWNFDTTYSAGNFKDSSGASYVIGSLANGAAIPGTHWVKLSATSIKTKGGLLREYSSTTGRLMTVRWASSTYPQL